jgi:hypothetical protein
MLGDISIAELRVFLILVWFSVADVFATFVFYKLHFRRAFAMAAYSGLISLVLSISIWGYVWLQ